MMLVPKLVRPPVAVFMSVATFWLLWISLAPYKDLSAIIILYVPVPVSGSPLGFDAVFAPLYTTVDGLKELALRSAFPLNRSVPESEAVVTVFPDVVPLLVIMLGTAMTYTIPPVVVLAVSQPKFHRTKAMVGSHAAAEAMATRVFPS
jgi:hypothetical protein